VLPFVPKYVYHIPNTTTLVNTSFTGCPGGNTKSAAINLSNCWSLAPKGRTCN
jgi:hypothetical protein